MRLVKGYGPCEARPGGDHEPRRTATAAGQNCAPIPDRPGMKSGGPAATLRTWSRSRRRDAKRHRRPKLYSEGRRAHLYIVTDSALCEAGRTLCPESHALFLDRHKQHLP